MESKVFNRNRCADPKTLDALSGDNPSVQRISSDVVRLARPYFPEDTYTDVVWNNCFFFIVVSDVAGRPFFVFAFF